MEVLNKKTMASLLRNDVYIGRPSPLGNPFPMKSEKDRDSVVQQFRIYFIDRLLARDPEIEKAFKKLQPDNNLVCFCAPKACHGDIIKKLYLDFFFGQDYEAGLKKLEETTRAKENTMLAEYEEQNILRNITCQDGVLYNPELNNPSLDDLKEKYRHVLYRKVMAREARFENFFRELPISTLVQLIDKSESKPVWASLMVLKEVLEEVHEYASYDEATHDFKVRHNHDLIPFDPNTDGVTHINIYSKGKTELGRLLSNFAHTPFKHREHGHFSSIEGFWYWLSTGKKYDDLRSLYGFKAKEAGLIIRKKSDQSSYSMDPTSSEFQSEIKGAILQKIEQTPSLAEMLRINQLPLTHYYCWGNGDNYKITFPHQYTWITEYIADVQLYLNGKAHKLCIAGSRTIDDTMLIEQYLKDSRIRVIEIVSGMAKGVDRCALQIAKTLRLPVAKFPANWDKDGKAAGFIRNTTMANYCTFALLFWDGESHGTKHMKEQLETTETPFKLYRINRKDIAS